MNKSCKLVKKLEQLLKQLNCRSYLHHFGPKKNKLKQHLFALIAMEAFQLSLRRVEKCWKCLDFNVQLTRLCAREERKYRRQFGLV